MVNVYLMNLATNEGAWLNDLPLSNQEILDFIKEHNISTALNEEFIIADAECEGFELQIEQYDSIWEINKALHIFCELDEYQQDIVNAYMEANGNSLQHFYFALEELDNLILEPSVKTEEDLGYFLTECVFTEKIFESFKYYFNYESYGRDYILNAGATLTSYGCLFN